VIVGRAESRGNRLVMDEAPLGLAPLHGGGAADQMETTSGTMPRGFMAVDGA
jgi:hypothetical protein